METLPLKRLMDRFDRFLVDLDGVVYLGERPTPQAARTLRAIRSAGKAVLFVTNDPRHTLSEYADKLARLDIPAEPRDFLTSGRAAVLYLQREKKIEEPIFVVGSDGLRKELENGGGRVLRGAEGRHAKIVVVGGHQDFSYQELKIATLAIHAGALFVATNRDATFPMPDGLWPGTGPIVAAVETATAVTPVVVGKPENLLFEIALDLLGTGRDPGSRKRTAMIGDRLDSDILGGGRIGLSTLLVLSGCTAKEEAKESAVRPDYIIENLSSLLLPFAD